MESAVAVQTGRFSFAEGVGDRSRIARKTGAAMPRISHCFFRTAVIWFVIGISIGMYTRISRNYAFVAEHTHINLLGWVSNALFGAVSTRWTRPKASAGLYIAEKLGVTPATASVHLKVLTGAGFVRPLRIGKYTYFKRVEAALAELASEIAEL